MSFTAQSAQPPRTSQSRFAFLDLLKAIASNLIVLHHLAFYGPMADRVRPLMPGLIDWLAADGRIAVQVFLVIGGFLAAKSLAPQGLAPAANPFPAIVRRFMKLVPPFFAATLLAVGASALAAKWMTHASISPMPSVEQLAAHALLLHGVLGYESVSAGAWYVAIDFQLYALFALLLWLIAPLRTGFDGRPRTWLAPVLVFFAMAVSLLYFNRDADWDAWAPYFFGSYGLGALAWWVAERSRRPLVVSGALFAIVSVTLFALAIDFRSRIALALLTALALATVSRYGLMQAARRLPSAAVLGRISYSVFLVHFPVCLIVNAAFTRFVPAVPWMQAIGMASAWAASLAAGAIFYRWVEQPLVGLGLNRGSRARQKPVHVKTDMHASMENRRLTTGDH